MLALFRKSVPRLTTANVFCLVIVFAQTPLAYLPSKDAMAPLQALALDVLDAQKELAHATPGQRQNATATYMAISMALLPGNLVRMNLTGSRLNVTRELERSVQVTAAAAEHVGGGWWRDAPRRRELVAASKAVVLSAVMLPLFRRPTTRLMLSGLLLAGLAALGAIAFVNEWTPTMRLGLALIASAYEVRGGWRALKEEGVVGPAKPAKPAARAGAPAPGKSGKPRGKPKRS